MNTIYKFPLNITGSQQISMPRGAKILSVIEQYDKVVVYAVVDPNEKEMELRDFLVLGTGQPCHKDYLEEHSYLGTVSTFGGDLIWHIYYK